MDTYEKELKSYNKLCATWIYANDRYERGEIKYPLDPLTHRYVIPGSDDYYHYQDLCSIFKPPKESIYNLPLSKYNFIDGPRCIHILRSENMCIILLGERHVSRTNVDMSIPTQFYLKRLFKRNRDKMFDLYVETNIKDFLEHKTISTEGMSHHKMNHLAKYFQKCSFSRRKEMMCKNVRFHAIDYRDIYTDPLNKRSDYIDVEGLEEEMSNLERETENEDLNMLLNEIYGISSNMIEFKRAKEELLLYFDDILSKESRMNMYKYIHNILMSSDPDSEIPDIHNDPHVLEIYTLSRMFHTYKNYPYEARNIVVYAGDIHITNILDFLTDIGLKIVYTDCNQLDNYIEPPPLHKLESYLL